MSRISISINALILQDIRKGSGVIKFVQRNGATATAAPRAGASMLELCRDAGIDELDALCGGNCSCATCHIQLDAEGYALFPAPDDDEADLLNGCDHQTAHSRLACQLILPSDKVEVVAILHQRGERPALFVVSCLALPLRRKRDNRSQFRSMLLVVQ
jgi:2Fe-2S ferredoxin